MDSGVFQMEYFEWLRVVCFELKNGMLYVVSLG